LRLGLQRSYKPCLFHSLPIRITSVEMQSKSDIRKAVMQRRRGIAPEQRQRSENLIADLIRTLPEYRDASVVAIYFPVRGEADLLPLLADTGKTFLFPKVNGDDLCFYPAKTLDDFAPGSFGIPEPTCETSVSVQDIDLILVPALCFDEEGHRLGYGKGYYDRLLKDLPDIFTVGVCFDECHVTGLPVEPWDVYVDCVVTQTGVFRSTSVR
jgi:5-formyltetrahydrofolate cyclo-ligase